MTGFSGIKAGWIDAPHDGPSVADGNGEVRFGHFLSEYLDDLEYVFLCVFDAEAGGVDFGTVVGVCREGSGFGDDVDYDLIHGRCMFGVQR